MLRHPVLEACHHPVALTSFVGGVEVLLVEAGRTFGQFVAIEMHPALGIGLAELLGNGFRRVVEIPAPVGPADVVEHQDR